MCAILVKQFKIKDVGSIAKTSEEDEDELEESESGL